MNQLHYTRWPLKVMDLIHLQMMVIFHIRIQHFPYMIHQFMIKIHQNYLL